MYFSQHFWTHCGVGEGVRGERVRARERRPTFHPIHPQPSLPLPFLPYLLLGRLQVIAAEGVHTVPEAALHEGVVHAEAGG